MCCFKVEFYSRVQNVLNIVLTYCLGRIRVKLQSMVTIVLTYEPAVKSRTFE